MRAWILENGLLDQVGHHFNNSIGLRDECASRNIDARFVVNRNADPEVVQALEAQPLFDYTPYDLASTDALAGPIESLIIQGNAFGQTFASALADVRADDMVLVPTALQNELYGCALGLTRIPVERRPRLVLTFVMENFFALGTRRLGPLAPLYRFAARQLARVLPPERVLLGANSDEMAENVAAVIAQPVATFPIPKMYPPQSPSRGRDGDPVRVAILGHSRAEKGFLLVPALVLRCPELNFIVQVSPAEAHTYWNEAADDVRAAPNVELVEGTLATSAYHALMSRADIVLLPYDAALFPFRSSGVFSEAVAAGKVTVAPTGTWMAGHQAAGRAAGVTFEAFDVNSIAAALRQAVGRLSELSERAQVCAPAWRAERSTGAYMDLVLGHFGLRAVGAIPARSSDPAADRR
ncbi:MAG: glycosyltransferase [Betaproteobacteria bacterium]